MTAPGASTFPALLARLARRRRAAGAELLPRQDARRAADVRRARGDGRRARRRRCTRRSASGPGDRVAILAPNRLEIPVLVLALLRLGAVVVPLNPGSAAEDWAYILAALGRARACARRASSRARVRRQARPAFVARTSRTRSSSSDGRGPDARAAGARRAAWPSCSTPRARPATRRASRSGSATCSANAWSMARELRARRRRRSSRCCRSTTRTRSASA